MKEEDLLKEALEEEKKLKKEIIKERSFVDFLSSPLWYIVGIVFLMIFILSIFPLDAIKSDPEPMNIPLLSSLDTNFSIPSYNHTQSRRDDIIRFVQPNDEVVKRIADDIATRSCRDFSRTCYAKAIFYSVRDSFQYINDPPDEYVKSARETLKQPVGDCDDNAVLLANLLEAVGITTRFVFIPGHVFVQASIQEAKSKYKEQDGWISLDSTCKNCNFAEIPKTSGQYAWDYVG